MDAVVFSEMRAFIEDLTGIQLPESNYRQTATYIDGQMEQLHLSPDEYRSFARNDKDEYNRLLQVVTINETYFFREERLFIYLDNEYLPQFAGSSARFSGLPGQNGPAVQNAELNVWSSTCSSGEEAISLYLILSRHFSPGSGFALFASDISSDMLARFEMGEYRRSALRSDGRMFHPLLLERSDEEDSGRIRLHREVINGISRHQINLLNGSLDDLPAMDIILLRNTLIYMNTENKERIVDRVVSKLRSGGLLVLSAPEIPLISHPELKVLEQGSMYFLQKVDPGELTPVRLSGKIERLAECPREGIDEILTRHRRIRKVQQPGPAAEGEATAPHSRSRTQSPAQNDPVPGLRTTCRAVQRRLNNELCDPCSSALEQQVQAVIDFMHHINNQDIASARMILYAAGRNIPEALIWYFKGLIAWQKGSCKTAVESFSASLKLNSDFWPARFRKINCMTEDSSDRTVELKRSIQQIRSYIERGGYEFQFLLDGFNARYYELVCEKYLNSSHSREARNVH